MLTFTVKAIKGFITSLLIIGNIFTPISNKKESKITRARNFATGRWISKYDVTIPIESAD